MYNKKDEIGATLASVLAQDVAPAEVIVVDDGSTDGSPDIVRAFGSPLVRLVVQENAGVSAARNRGVAEARGRYVAFLDGDDRWEPGFIGKVSELIGLCPIHI